MEQKKYELKQLPKFHGRPGPLLFIILDGVGIGRKDKGDAFHLANPTNLLTWMEQAKQNKLFVSLQAHGQAVGLPSDEDMGNSEVGHNAIGSGQIYSQGSKLVNESILSGRIFKTPAWQEIVTATGKAGHTVHLIGLLSDGNVHSHIDQLFCILDGIAQSNVKRVRIHPLLDGRDVANDSALLYVDKLEQKLAKLNREYSMDARIASGGGRMYVTMDRYYADWKMVRRGWNTHVRGVIEPEDITSQYPGYFKTVHEAIETARRVYPDKKDQFNPPFVIVDEHHQPIGKIHDGDAVINFNFRGDRAIEISEAFILENFKGFERVEHPKVKYAGLLEYDTEIHLPPKYLVPPPDIRDVAAQYLGAMKVSSYAIAETHKYGHVTYFWNGNRSGYVYPEFEKYEEVASDANDMIESHPEMKAKEVTEKLMQALRSKKYKFLRVNYANGDMVGHTGNIQSCIKAVQTLDACLPQVITEVLQQQGIVIITADHGNVEEKFDKQGKIKTSHTLNPVPFFVLDSAYQGEYTLSTEGIAKPGIANMTATFLELLGFAAPEFYEKSLVRFQA